MKPIGGYLDLNLMINGIMDAFLLVVTGRILHFPIKKGRISFGVLLGAVPVIMTLMPDPFWLSLSKMLIPFAMIATAFPWQGGKSFLKAIVGFWLISASLGGFVYALWGWVKWGSSRGGESLQLLLSNLWIFPLPVILWWALYKLWNKWQERNLLKRSLIVDLEIEFTAERKINVRALVDTGNQLHDPMTRKPVILLEEEVAGEALPDGVKELLRQPWREAGDPWTWLLKAEPEVLRYALFIPLQTVERQSWVMGVRPYKIRSLTDGGKELAATIALIPRKLSAEGDYQALSHPVLHCSH